MTEYVLIASAKKTNLMTFKGRDPDRSKLLQGNKITQHVNYFSYLGKLIPYVKELDIDNTLNNYLKLTGIISRMFRPQKF